MEEGKKQEKPKKRKKRIRCKYCSNVYTPNKFYFPRTVDKSAWNVCRFCQTRHQEELQKEAAQKAEEERVPEAESTPSLPASNVATSPPLPPDPPYKSGETIINEDGEKELYVEPPFKPFAKQWEFLSSPARFRIVVAGVRGGKTKAGVFELARKALITERGHFWCVSPTYKMLDVAERDFKDLMDRSGEGAGVTLYEYEKKERRYTLPSNSIIEFRSAEWPDTMRGPGLDGLLFDEAAYAKEEAANIARTRVSDKLGRIWICTTPRGKNWVHRWYLRGLDERHKNYASFRWTSLDNPHFPKSEWEDAKKDLPSDVFGQEYEAKFLDDVAGVFRDVEGIVTKEAITTAKAPFSLGLDLAKSRDFTVLIVMDAEGRVVDFERMNELSWVIQKEEAVRLAEKWNAKIVMDSTGPGDPIHDELIDTLGYGRVEGIKFSVNSKRQMIQALQSAVEQKQILIPDIDILIDELRWFEYKRLPSGTVRYEAPRGFTDDCVFSLALANWGRLQRAATGNAVILDSEPDSARPDLGLSGSHAASPSFWGRPRARMWRN